MEMISAGVVLLLLVLLFHVVLFGSTYVREIFAKWSESNETVHPSNYRLHVRRRRRGLCRRTCYQAFVKYQQMQHVSAAYLDNVYRLIYGGRR